jgi:hypothetical protein
MTEEFKRAVEKEALKELKEPSPNDKGPSSGPQ